MPSERKEEGIVRKSRFLIVSDGDYWYIRRVISVEHDLDKDHKVYRCDKPIGTRYELLDTACTVLKHEMKKRGTTR